LVLAGGCTSKKELTESSALALLRERTDKRKYMIPLSGLMRLMTRTREDYSSGNGTADATVLKELLARGLVVQHVDTVSYPKISGRFAGTFAYGNGEHYTEGYDLETGQDSNTLSGDQFYIEPGRGINQRDKIAGTVMPDGGIDLHTTTGDYYWQMKHATYTEEGSLATLKFRGQSASLNGKATGQKVAVKWYQYEFSPETMRQIEKTSAGSHLAGGEYEVGEVTDLRLVTETAAVARFSWHVSLNSFGQIISSGKEPSGNGGVSFAKKPDGTWFVDEVDYH